MGTAKLEEGVWHLTCAMLGDTSPWLSQCSLSIPSYACRSNSQLPSSPSPVIHWLSPVMFPIIPSLEFHLCSLSAECHFSFTSPSHRTQGVGAWVKGSLAGLVLLRSGTCHKDIFSGIIALRDWSCELVV